MTNHKILLIDEDDNFSKSVQRLLMLKGFEVTITNSPYEALHFVSKQEFSVIFSEYRLPFMEGTALLQKIKEICPDTVRIILTESADVRVAMEAINQGEVFRFLSKPWQEELLVSTITEAMEQFERTKQQKAVYSQNEEFQSQYQKLVSKSVDKSFENRQLIHKLEKSRFTSIEVLARTIQLTNKRIWHHTQRVKKICLTMAKLIDLPKDKCLQLEVAALLHDIGQIGIPVEIWRKPESDLTDAEKELIRNHSLHGYTLLKSIPGFTEAAYFIRHHHECFNGKGYPDGLVGENIPYGAKIIAVADAYEKRLKGQMIFPVALEHEAFQFVESQSGKLFDPAVITLLKECILAQSRKPDEGYLNELKQYWNIIVTAERNCPADIEEEQVDCTNTVSEPLLFDLLPLQGDEDEMPETKTVTEEMNNKVLPSLGDDIQDYSHLNLQAAEPTLLVNSEEEKPLQTIAPTIRPKRDTINQPDVFPLSSPFPGDFQVEGLSSSSTPRIGDLPPEELTAERQVIPESDSGKLEPIPMQNSTATAPPTESYSLGVT